MVFAPKHKLKISLLPLTQGCIWLKCTDRFTQMKEVIDYKYTYYVWHQSPRNMCLIWTLKWTIHCSLIWSNFSSFPHWCRLNAEKGNTTEKFSNLPALSCAVSKELSQHYFINKQSNFLKLCFPHFVVVDGKRIKQQTYLKASRHMGTHSVGSLSPLVVVSG